jgi:hypothetical protein
VVLEAGAVLAATQEGAERLARNPSAAHLAPPAVSADSEVEEEREEDREVDREEARR